MKNTYKRDRLQKLANLEPFNSEASIQDAFDKVTIDKINNCIRHSRELLEDLNTLAWT